MAHTAPVSTLKPATLDSLYAIIRDDLKAVDALILNRVKSEVGLIENIARHIIASGGKRIRPALTLISARLCGYQGDQHIALATAIEFIHTATLLHDDVVDASALRRGMPTANEEFGNKASVLVGDFLLSQAFQLSVEEGSPRVLEILADASAIIAQGEVMQLMTERDLDTTVEAYLQIISSKTAALFAAACELGGEVSGDRQAAATLKEFGMQLGIAFQITDDVLDYAANQERLGKTVGDDFREGKITLPVIIAYHAGTREEKDFWQRTLGDLDQRPEDFNTACALLARHQAATQTLALAGQYCQKARAALSGFAAGTAKSAMLDAVDFALSRAY